MERGYVSITNTIESTRVVVDTEDPNFIAFRFYNGREVVANIYASCPMDKEFVMLSPIDYKDQTILLEAEDVQTDTTE